MDVLHPSGFVETGVCSGPRRARSQPSRETPGVLLADKYVVEWDEADSGVVATSEGQGGVFQGTAVDFNMPFRNSIRSIKELSASWSRLFPDQRAVLSAQYLSGATFLGGDGTPGTATPSPLLASLNKELSGLPTANPPPRELDGGIIAIIVLIVIVVILIGLFAGIAHR